LDREVILEKPAKLDLKAIVEVLDNLEKKVPSVLLV
jgi:hypothetical protein